LSYISPCIPSNTQHAHASPTRLHGGEKKRKKKREEQIAFLNPVAEGAAGRHSRSMDQKKITSDGYICISSYFSSFATKLRKQKAMGAISRQSNHHHHPNAVNITQHRHRRFTEK